MSDLCSDMAYGREEWRNTPSGSCRGNRCSYRQDYENLKEENKKLKQILSDYAKFTNYKKISKRFKVRNFT